MKIKFIKSKYEEDKVKLIEFYNENGYRDAKLISDTVYLFKKSQEPRHKGDTGNIALNDKPSFVVVCYFETDALQIGVSPSMAKNGSNSQAHQLNHEFGIFKFDF